MRHGDACRVVRGWASWRRSSLTGIILLGALTAAWQAPAFADGADAGAFARAMPVGADPRPWEPDELGAEPVPERSLSVSQRIGLACIHWYQESVAVRSISRCPYALSCSRYAAEAIRRRGLLLGLCSFIDRNLYRENPGMVTRYTWTVREDGTLKLDDGFFLVGAP